MEFPTKLAKVGNSHRVLIPKTVVNYLEWKDGTELKLMVTDHRIVIEKA